MMKVSVLKWFTLIKLKKTYDYRKIETLIKIKIVVTIVAMPEKYYTSSRI